MDCICDLTQEEWPLRYKIVLYIFFDQVRRAILSLVPYGIELFPL